MPFTSACVICRHACMWRNLTSTQDRKFDLNYKGRGLRLVYFLFFIPSIGALFRRFLMGRTEIQGINKNTTYGMTAGLEPGDGKLPWREFVPLCVCVAFDVINLPHKEPPYEESITTSNRDYQKSADDVQELIRIVLMWNKEVTDRSIGGGKRNNGNGIMRFSGLE